MNRWEALEKWLQKVDDLLAEHRQTQLAVADLLTSAGRC